MSWADDAKDRARSAARKACNAIGRVIRDDIREDISEVGPPPDRSEPYDPPYYVEGDLWRSVDTKPNTSNLQPSVIVYQDDSIAPHGKWLEAGTDKMLPRPFFSPVRERWRRKINSVFKSLFEQFFKGD
jgi:hypothetical protein